LACNLATPCFGREPKAKVATDSVEVIEIIIAIIDLDKQM